MVDNSSPHHCDKRNVESAAVEMVRSHNDSALDNCYPIHRRRRCCMESVVVVD